ncbi:MAG: EAL domain-containing protein [Lachnospiraceae bacterium]|nr:EAL domain-containing protein [Lachnospiraceae bacterium]
MNKSKKRKKKISLQSRILVCLMAAVLFQGILYMAILHINGGFRYLEENASQRLVNTVSSRKNELENLMVHGWSHIDDYEWRINNDIGTFLSEQGKSTEDLASDEQLSQAALARVSENLVEMLRQTGTNEAFIILDSDGSSNTLNGFHIRDLDPAVNLGGDDLMLETGSAELAGSMGITLDSLWESRFQRDDLLEFYSKLVSDENDYSEFSVENLGYWSEAFQWRDKDWTLISYAMPLMNDAHEIYGLIGISVSESYLKSLMPSKELNSTTAGCYILSKRGNSDGTYFPIMTSGIFREDMVDGDGSFSFEEISKYNQLHAIKDSDIYGTGGSLALYNASSPFYGEQWALQAIVPEDILFRNAHHLNFMIQMAFLISVGAGSLIAVLASYYLNRPIQELVDDIRVQEADKEFQSIPSGIREIDELREAIAAMDNSIRENVSRLSRIIKMINLPLGAIEYSEKEAIVYCTSQVVPVLHMEPSAYENGGISREYFEKFWKDAGLEKFLKESGEIEYSILDNGEEYWIHIESWIGNHKVFIIVMDQTEEIIEKQQLEHERDYDILTNLLSRRAFNHRVEHMLSKHGDMELGAMIMWDLDNLKYVNDSYGHDYGDQYIRQAAQVFGGITAEYPGALIGRISGDEFMAFLPNCQGKQEVFQELDDIRQRLHDKKLMTPDGESLSIRASGGVAWYPHNGTTLVQLKKCADFAMYDAKTSYKGFYKEYNQRSFDRDGMLLEGKEELNWIIEDKQVEYYFQPIVSAADGEVFAYEALMRPKTRLLKSAGDVVRIAADQSRLGELEALTFEMAFYFQHLQGEDFENTKLFVNSIPNQLMDEDALHNLFEQYPECTGRLVVEIIENEHVDSEIMCKKQELARRYGAEIALDDFGSGYSTEERLLYLKPRYVKVDISLIRGISKDRGRQSLVQNLLNYAHPRGIKVIAEGVESYDDMKAVIQLGADYIQGDYLGKAESRAKLVDFEKVQEIQEIHKKGEKML